MQSYRKTGDEAFGYFGVVKPMFGVIIGLSIVEVPGVDIIVARVVPWEPARWIVLALGVWGLLWAIGYAATLHRNPHLVGESGIRVRLGRGVDFLVPWDAVEQVSKRNRSLHGTKSVQVEDGILHVGVASQTTMDIRLVRPQPINLRKGPTEPVSEVRIYADDPDGFRVKAESLCPKRSTPRSGAPASPTR